MEPWEVRIDDTRDEDSRRVFIIFCEDGAVEPAYFETFKRKGVQVSPIGNAKQHHAQIDIATEYFRKNGLIEVDNEGNEYLKIDDGAQVRQGATKHDLTSASEQDVLDEYARELCGEFDRWALLKRHHAFEKVLSKSNPRAAASFKSAIDYYRPISYDFLSQIDNAEQYGDNGYGQTGSSGLNGFLNK